MKEITQKIIALTLNGRAYEIPVGDGRTDMPEKMCIRDRLLREKRARVKVLETRDRWFGVTYRQDRELVAEALRGLIAEGMYGDGMTGVRRG